MVWHAETALPKGTDLVVVPGGFSYGDYLRCGAIAARAPVMDAVRAFAAEGGLVLGVCNGFQILCEVGPAARRADAQCAAEIHLPRRASAGRALRHAVHPRLQCRAGDPRAGRPWRGQLRGRRGDHEAAGRRGAGALSLLLGRRRGRRSLQYQRRGAIDRRHRQRARQCARHDAASGKPRRRHHGLHRRPRPVRGPCRASGSA